MKNEKSRFLKKIKINTKTNISKNERKKENRKNLKAARHRFIKYFVKLKP